MHQLCNLHQSDDIDHWPLKSLAKNDLHSSDAARLARLSDMCLLIGHIHIYHLAAGGVARVVVLIVANSSLASGQHYSFSLCI